MGLSTRIVIELPTSIGVLGAIMQTLGDRFPDIQLGEQEESENAVILLIPNDTVVFYDENDENEDSAAQYENGR